MAFDKYDILVPPVSEQKQSGTERAIAKAIEKLHLEPGDLILVTDPRLAQALSQMRLQFPFFVPVVITPPGGIKHMTINECTEVLKQLIKLKELEEKTDA